MQRLIYSMVSCCLLLLIFDRTNAQWTDDTYVNTVIDPTAGAKGITHIKQTPDGKYFISWYGGATNYNMNLALLDNDGVALWNSPKVVSFQDQNPWLADYSLEVDSEGNAIIAFSDVRNDNEDLVIYKVSQSGDMLFGNNGILLTETPESETFPTMCITESDDIVITWQQVVNGESVVMVMQRLDTEGDKLWGDDGITLSLELADYNTPLPIATSNDEVIVLYHLQTGPFFAPARTLHAQRFDTDGNAVWDMATTLCGETNIPGYTFPRVKKDGAGGLITSWHDDRDENMVGNVAVQHLHEDGSLQFSVDGVELVHPQNMGHFSPRVAGIDEDGNITVYWRTTSSSQGESGLHAQKVTPDGTLAWGENGIELLPLGSSVQLVTDAIQKGDSSWVCYAARDMSNLSDNHVLMSGLNGSGDLIMEEEPVGTSNDSKSDIDLSSIFNGQAVATWVDDASPHRIKAQRVVLFDAMTSIWEYSDNNSKILEQRGSAILINPSAGVGRLEIYSIDGRMLKEWNVKDINRIELPDELSGAVYVVVAKDDFGQKLDSKRIIW